MINNTNNPYWICNIGDTTSVDYYEQSVTLVFPPRLIKLTSGEFQVTEIGTFQPILRGNDYILIPRKIAHRIKHLIPNQVNIKDIRIFRRATNQEWLDYSEIIIKKEFLVKDYSKIECQGLQAYCLMKSMLYVSPELKTKLEEDLKEFTTIKAVQGIPILGG